MHDWLLAHRVPIKSFVCTSLRRTLQPSFKDCQTIGPFAPGVVGGSSVSSAELREDRSKADSDQEGAFSARVLATPLKLAGQSPRSPDDIDLPLKPTAPLEASTAQRLWAQLREVVTRSEGLHSPAHSRGAARAGNVTSCVNLFLAESGTGCSDDGAVSSFKAERSGGAGGGGVKQRIGGQQNELQSCVEPLVRANSLVVDVSRLGDQQPSRLSAMGSVVARRALRMDSGGSKPGRMSSFGQLRGSGSPTSGSSSNASPVAVRNDSPFLSFRSFVPTSPIRKSSERRSCLGFEEVAASCADLAPVLPHPWPVSPGPTRYSVLAARANALSEANAKVFSDLCGRQMGGGSAVATGRGPTPIDHTNQPSSRPPHTQLPPSPLPPPTPLPSSPLPPPTPLSSSPLPLPTPLHLSPWSSRSSDGLPSPLPPSTLTHPSFQPPPSPDMMTPPSQPTPAEQQSPSAQQRPWGGSASPTPVDSADRPTAAAVCMGIQTA